MRQNWFVCLLVVFGLVASGRVFGTESGTEGGAPTYVLHSIVREKVDCVTVRVKYSGTIPVLGKDCDAFFLGGGFRRIALPEGVDESLVQDFFADHAVQQYKNRAEGQEASDCRVELTSAPFVMRSHQPSRILWASILLHKDFRLVISEQCKK